MEALIRLITRQCRWFALAFLLITVLLGLQLPKITVRNSVRDILSGNEATYENYEAFLRDFGGNATVVLEFDASLSASRLSDQVREVLDQIDSTIATNDLVLWVRSAGRELVVPASQLDRLASEWPSIEEIQLTITPQNSNHFTPSPSKIAIAKATVDGEEEYLQALVERVNAIVESASSEGRVLLYGSAVFNEILKSTMTVEMLRFFVIAFLIVSAFSYLFLSSVSGSLLSMLTLLLGVVWSLSFLAILDIPVSGTLQLFPFFVLVIGTCYVIHSLTIFYKKWEDTGDKSEAIVLAYRTCSRAVLGASATTFLGLISFCLIEVKVVAQLGLISAIGTICMGVITLVFLPAFLALLPFPKPGHSRASHALRKLEATVTRWVTAAALGAAKRAKTTLLVTLALVLLAVSQFRHLEFVYSPEDWLPESMEISEVARERIASGKWNYVVELVLESGQETGGIFSRDFLGAYNALVTELESQKDALEILQIDTVRRALPEGQSLDATVQSTPELQSTYLRSFVDDSFSKTKLQVTIPWGDHHSILRRVGGIETLAQKVFPFPFHITGKPIILAQMSKNLIDSLNYGYLFAFVTVFLVMFLLLRRRTLNFICLFPNLLPIVLILGLLGLFHVPLDVLLLLTSTIILSTSVDDTLHLLLHVRNHLQDHPGAPSQEVFRAAHREVGFGIVATSCLITLSFGIFTLSSFPILRTAGLAIALGAVFALLADVLLVPALYSSLTSIRARRAERRQPEA